MENKPITAEHIIKKISSVNQKIEDTKEEIKKAEQENQKLAEALSYKLPVSKLSKFQSSSTAVSESFDAKCKRFDEYLALSEEVIYKKAKLASMIQPKECNVKYLSSPGTLISEKENVYNKITEIQGKIKLLNMQIEKTIGNMTYRVRNENDDVYLKYILWLIGFLVVVLLIKILF